MDMSNVERLKSHQLQQVQTRPTPPSATGKQAEITLFKFDPKKDYKEVQAKKRDFKSDNPSSMPEAVLSEAIFRSIPKGIIGQS